MLRKILAVVLGAFAGGVFNMALINVSNAVYPPLAGVDPNDIEAFRAHVVANGLATGALAIVLVAHAGGSLPDGHAAWSSPCWPSATGRRKICDCRRVVGHSPLGGGI